MPWVKVSRNEWELEGRGRVRRNDHSKSYIAFIPRTGYEVNQGPFTRLKDAQQVVVNATRKRKKRE